MSHIRNTDEASHRHFHLRHDTPTKQRHTPAFPKENHQRTEELVSQKGEAKSNKKPTYLSHTVTLAILLKVCYNTKSVPKLAQFPTNLQLEERA
jgi:hypothetical protein